MSLYAITALARQGLAKTLVSLVVQGRIVEATGRAEALLESSPGADDADVALLCGDLMLAQDRDEEAEEMYRLAVRAAAHAPRGQVRVVSCRSTGFMSLYQQRFGTAAACFRRIAEDPVASAAQRTEALVALGVALHAMGQTAAATAALDEAAEVAGEAATDLPLATLVSLVRVELSVQQEIRSHAALHDHVFWNAAPCSRARSQMEPLAALDACLAAHGNWALVAERLRHLRALVLATCGDAAAMQALPRHLACLREKGLSSEERQSRLDVALVAIVARQADMARQVLEPLCSRAADGPRERWNLELSYCLAKLAALNGRGDESMQHYQRYALESVQRLRTESPGDAHAGRSAVPAERPVRDDVEMGLPAKYRRAYRYMLDHLDCVSLSVREIAEHVGVTERALQAVFRSHLGMTPVEVMRRCRVERIRNDLINDEGSRLTVIEAAARWGIRNRSTLVSAYRKHFDETPAETLGRHGGGAPLQLRAAA
jgi:AraC-like DNA-binding protein